MFADEQAGQSLWRASVNPSRDYIWSRALHRRPDSAGLTPTPNPKLVQQFQWNDKGERRMSTSLYAVMGCPRRTCFSPLGPGTSAEPLVSIFGRSWSQVVRHSVCLREWQRERGREKRERERNGGQAGVSEMVSNRQSSTLFRRKYFGCRPVREHKSYYVSVSTRLSSSTRQSLCSC